jgi:hypothetical protein
MTQIYQAVYVIILLATVTGIKGQGNQTVKTGDQVILYVNGVEAPVQWQQSSDSLHWINIEGATLPQFEFITTGSPSGKMHYRAVIVTECGTFNSKVISHRFVTSITELVPGDLFRGGIVFFSDQQLPFIVSDSDDTTSVRWGCNAMNIHTNNDDGKYNTASILSQCSERPVAASVCGDSQRNGYTDWFLPARQQLLRMREANNVINYTSAYYWSSSHAPSSQHLLAWARNLSSSLPDYAQHRNNTYHVRCIREVKVNDISRSFTHFEQLPVPVQITSSPQDINICYGTDFQLVVTATGTGPLNWQWQRDGSNIPGATSNILIFTEASSDLEGEYSCIVSNSCETAISSSAMVGVIEISAWAGEDESFCNDMPFQINATATTSHPGQSGQLQYFWYPQTGLDDHTLLNPVAQPEESTTYQLTVTDEIGCSASHSMHLTSNSPVVITTAPLPASKCPGDDLLLSVNTTGSQPIYYQWFRDGQALENEYSNQLFFENITSAEQGTYKCQITNMCGSIFTEDAIINVIEILVNAGNDDSFCNDMPYQINATATTSHPAQSGQLQYFWYPQTGLNDHTLLNPVAQPEGNTTYTLTVTDQIGCQANDSFTLTSNTPVFFITNPLSTNACNSAEIILGISTGGTEPVSLQWKKDGQDLMGQTNDLLVFPFVSMENQGSYWVMASNICNTAESLPAIVNVVMVQVEVSSQENICPGQSIILSPTVQSNHPQISGTFTWQWEPPYGLSNPEISNPLAGPETSTLYMVSVSDQLGCTDTASVNVIVDLPYEQEKICMVSVNPETSVTMIYWQGSMGFSTAGYNIYRRAAAGYNQWTLLGYSPFAEENVFIDNEQEHGVEYSIAVVDSCGNHSGKSPSHSPIWLSISQQANIVELNWWPYGDESGISSPEAYFIFRGNSPQNLYPIDTVPANHTTYIIHNDISANWYAVATLFKHNCSDNFFSWSNTVESAPLSATIYSQLNKQITISPNPFVESTLISFFNPENHQVLFTLFDMTGRIVESQNLSGQEIIFSRKNLPSGLYFINITKENNIQKAKLIVK